jgi:hypothetical protein
MRLDRLLTGAIVVGAVVLVYSLFSPGAPEVAQGFYDTPLRVTGKYSRTSLLGQSSVRAVDLEVTASLLTSVRLRHAPFGSASQCIVVVIKLENLGKVPYTFMREEFRLTTPDGTTISNASGSRDFILMEEVAGYPIMRVAEDLQPRAATERALLFVVAKDLAALPLSLTYSAWSSSGSVPLFSLSPKSST